MAAKYANLKLMPKSRPFVCVVAYASNKSKANPKKVGFFCFHTQQSPVRHMLTEENRHENTLLLRKHLELSIKTSVGNDYASTHDPKPIIHALNSYSLMQRVTAQRAGDRIVIL